MRSYCRCDAAVGTDVVDGGLILCSECGNVRADPLILAVFRQQRNISRQNEAILKRLNELEGTRGEGEENNTQSSELIDAAEMARRFGKSRDWVYSHADELGAIRVGKGPKRRPLFDPTQVPDRLAALAARNGAVKPEPKPPLRRRKRKASIEKLPVKGRMAA